MTLHLTWGIRSAVCANEFIDEAITYVSLPFKINIVRACSINILSFTNLVSGDYVENHGTRL